MSNNIENLNKNEIQELLKEADKLEEIRKAHNKQQRKEKIEHIKNTIKNWAQKAGHAIKSNAKKAGNKIKTKWDSLKNTTKKKYDKYVHYQMVISDLQEENNQLKQEIHNLQNELNKEDNDPIYVTAEEENVSGD